MPRAPRIAAFLALLVSCAGFTDRQARAAEPAGFLERVAPVLRQRCVSCHNSKKSRGGLDLTTRERLLKGGNTGPAIRPGDSAASLLVEMVSGPEPRMPKQGA